MAILPNAKTWHKGGENWLMQLNELKHLEDLPSKINSNTSKITIKSVFDYKGSFEIYNSQYGILEGKVFSENPAISFSPSVFSGNKISIEYEISLDFRPIDGFSSEIIIQSNGGELLIPFEIDALSNILYINDKIKLKNLNEFMKFAEKDAVTALKIFTTNDFLSWLYESDYEFIDVYKELIKDSNKYRSMFYFFVFNGLKTNIQLTPEQEHYTANLEYDQNFATGRIKFIQDAQGYYEYPISTDVEWLKFSTSTLKTLDFNSKIVNIDYIITKDKVQNKHAKIFLNQTPVATLSLKLKPPFLAKLNKKSYNSSLDFGTIFIENYTNKELEVKIETENPMIKLKSIRHFIIKTKKIEFSIKQSNKFFNKEPNKSFANIQITTEMVTQTVSMPLRLDFFDINAKPNFDFDKEETKVFAKIYDYWIKYRIHSDISSLLRACKLLEKLPKNNPVSLFLKQFLLFELEDEDALKSNALAIKSYKSSLKNDEKLYPYIVYSNILLGLATKKRKILNRDFNELAGLCKNSRYAEHYLILAHCAMLNSNIDFMDICLNKAYKLNSNSSFFYVLVAQILEYKLIDSKIFSKFINWALNKKYELKNILFKYQDLLSDILTANIIGKAYIIYDENWILEALCKKYINNDDISQNAFKYYNTASRRQMDFPNLQDFLIRAAYTNNIDFIKTHSLSKFLNAELSSQAEPFIYHLILKKGTDSIDSFNSQRIIDLAISYVRSNSTDKHCSYMYKFLIDNYEQHSIPYEIVQSAENLLKNSLFLHKIDTNDPEIKYISVSEETKKNATLVKVQNLQTHIRIFDINAAEVYFLDKNMLRIKKPLTLNPYFECDDISFMLKICSEKPSLDLLLFICTYALKNDNVEEKYMQFLYIILERSEISPNFKLKVYMLLAAHHAKNSEFEVAAELYRNSLCMLKKFDNSEYEKMLIVFSKVSDWENAGKIILEHYLKIPKEALFNCINSFLDCNTNSSYFRHFLPSAFFLLTKKCFSQKIIDFVVQNYETNLNKLLELYQILQSQNKTDSNLAKKILIVSLKTRQKSPKIQEVFVNSNYEKYAIYLAHEAIMSNFLPENDTIYALEKIFLKAQNLAIIGYSLVHIYVLKKLETKSSLEITQKVLKFSVNENIIFPFFKQINQKDEYTSYIEKYSAFMFFGKSSQSVKLCYKVSGKENFEYCKMKYIGYSIYLCHIVHFYGEEVEYYFKIQDSEDYKRTESRRITKTSPGFGDIKSDTFFNINRAIIHEQLFRYDDTERIISQLLQTAPSTLTKML